MEEEEDGLLRLVGTLLVRDSSIHCILQTGQHSHIICCHVISYYHDAYQSSTVRDSPGHESSVDPRGDPGSHSTVPCIPRNMIR